MINPEDLQDDIYHLRRLREARRAQSLSARQHVILAADGNLDDDALEYAQSVAGGAEFGKSGWGMSEVFDDLLSREPKKVKSSSLKALQQNLRDQGYVNPNTPVDGVWSPLYSAAFRRFDRDNEETVRGGKHWLSAPVETGLRTLGYVLPSQVYSGILGAAKGIVEQSGETLERGGLAGGAIGGAAIGTAIAPGPGTLIGAVAGGVGGFFADLFGESEEEEDQSGWERFVDALSPLEEYKAQGPKAFFEDLGFILSAASIIRGGAMAATGAKAGMGQIALRGALTKSVPAQPGLIARAVGAGTRKFSSSAADTWINVARHHGLLAQTSRPLLQTVNGTFRGLAAGSVGARLAGGLGSGKEKTTIERGIEEAPELPHGDLVDNTLGLVVFSDKFLPIKSGGVSKAARAALTAPKEVFTSTAAARRVNDYIDSGVALKPYVHVAQKRNADGTVMSHGQAKEAVLQTLGRDNLERTMTDLWLRMEYGLHRRAGEMLNDIPDIDTAVRREKLWQDALFDTKRKLRAEWDEGGTDLTNDLLRYSHNDPTDTANGPMAFTGFLEGLDGFGSSLERMGKFRHANKRVGEVMRGYETGQLDLQVREGLEGVVTDVSKTFKDYPTNFEATTIRSQAQSLEKQASDLEKRAAKAVNFDQQERMLGRAGSIREEAKSLRRTIPKQKRPKRKRPFTVTVARLPDPETGAPGYSTEQDILGFADEYERKSGAVRTSYERYSGPGSTPDANKAYKLAQEDLNQFSQGLFQRGLVTQKDLDLMKRADPYPKIADRLRERAKYHGKDVVVPDEINSEFGQMGYRLIATRDDVLMFDEIDRARRLLEATGVGDYTRRAAFFDTLGLSPWKHTDRSLFALRRGHEDAELQQVLTEHGIKLTGKQAMRKLHDYLNAYNHDRGTLLGPLIIRNDAPKWSEKFQLYKVDTRELTPDDIAQALDLDGVVPKNVELVDDVAKVTPIDDPYEIANDIYGAVKRGAAAGGEADFRKPVAAARMLGKALRINGLPGFSDFMRTWHVPQGGASPAVLRGLGAIGGAAAGAEVGSRVGGPLGAVGGAVMGGIGGGMVGPKFTKGTYGYLPDHLHRLNMALRYSLSPFFDAGRYMEQNMLGMTKAGLPAIVNPKRYITRHYGESAWSEAVDLWDEVNGFKKGKGMLRVIDDTDRRMFQRGMLGFSPRYHEAAQMFLLRRRGMSNTEIEDTVAQIGRYGVGRTAAEKTTNFIFFPYSFQKKLVSTLGDFVLQAPGRAVMLHEGVRRFFALDENYEEGENSIGRKFAEFMEDKVPLGQTLARLNNLSYGISPGRFFLEGVGDQSTDAGKAAQILGSFFVPSGAATPVAQALGGLGDAAMQFFVPTAVTGDEVNGLDDILNRYIPIVRDIEQFWQTSAEQITAVTEGAAPYSQLQDYLDEKRGLESDLEPVATALGYASVDGFLQSDVGLAIKPMIDAQEGELGQKYPSALRLLDSFDRTENMDRQALFDLANRSEKSPEEEDLVRLTELEQMGAIIADVAGLDAKTMQPIVQSMVRRFALERADNKQFVSLYERFFGREYGPISRIAA